jgi:hypothetical protein
MGHADTLSKSISVVAHMLHPTKKCLCQIDVINVHTGVIRSSLRQAWCLGDRAVELHLCGNFLLAAVPHDADDYDDEKEDEKAARKAGIYILDRSSLELMNHVAGKYVRISSAANGDVVAEKADWRFDIFQLDGDRLIFRTSFHRYALSRNNRNDLKSIF